GRPGRSRRAARHGPRRGGDRVSTTMSVLHGSGVGRGAVCGPVARAHPAPVVDQDAPAPADRDEAVAAVREAFAAVGAALEERAAQAGGTIAEVLGATALMAQDPELTGQVVSRIEGGQAATVAVDRAVAEFADLFAAAGGYLAER